MRRLLGFSLIELMIALTIVGILSAIAYPSYTQYVVRSRRADGKAALLDLAARMERHFSNNNTYANATIAAAPATDVLAAANSPEGWYNLSITAQSATAFTLQATPQNAQAAEDTLCASLTYNNLGVKGITGTSTVARCW